MIVVDASVVAAICFVEPRADEAAALLNDYHLAAPMLLPFELANLARSKALAHPDDADKISSNLQKALKFKVTLMPVDHYAVYALSVSTGLTAYDASYLHLARVLTASLATFDRRLAAAAARG